MTGEGGPKMPESPFHKGALVRFKEDLKPSTREAIETTFDITKTYKVFHIHHHEDEGGDAIYLGPIDASQSEVDNFDPENQDPKRAKIFPVSVHHLTIVAN